MINRLVEELKKFLPRKGLAIDPAVFDDPVALKTEWSPVKGGGSNFRTHALRLTPEGRAVFRPTAGFLAFCGLFLFVGLAIDIAVTVAILKAGKSLLSAEWLMPVGIGSVFAVVGGCLLAFGAQPVVFDKQAGSVWTGWREPRQNFEHGSEKSGILCALDDVHAVQIVSEYLRGNKSSYTSYELNLVRVDGTRINVVDHGDIDQIRKDAAALGEYLEAAVWDSTL